MLSENEQLTFVSAVKIWLMLAAVSFAVAVIMVMIAVGGSVVLGLLRVVIANPIVLIIIVGTIMYHIRRR